MALAFTTAGRAMAGSSSGKITIRVDSVVASDTHEGIDVRLSSMGPRLQSLFSYTTYRLVSQQDRQTQVGGLLSFELPGGRILHVQPRGIEGNMIAMELVLFQGERPVMTTDLKLRNHGVFMVGGPRYDQGMLIISIAADSPSPRLRSADAGAPSLRQAAPAAATPEASSFPQ